MTYDVNFFISEFEPIPEERWTVGVWESDGACCVGGHCGNRNYEHTNMFKRLESVLSVLKISNRYTGGLWSSFNAVSINDGFTKEYQQPTPKQRILAALYDIKKMQSREQEDKRSVATGLNSSTEAKPIKEKIRYVAVSETINKEVILN